MAPKGSAAHHRPVIRHCGLRLWVRRGAAGLLCWLAWNCAGTNYLLRVSPVGCETSGPEIASGYIDRRGDTVIPVGKYWYCESDTIREWGFVWLRPEQRKNRYDLCIAIDRKDRKLFNAYWFDNGPDYPSEGLFRIRDDRGRIGYADTTGRIVIRPRFRAAYPFRGGQAEVALRAWEQRDGEYTYWQSDRWFLIDRKGRKIGQE